MTMTQTKRREYLIRYLLNEQSNNHTAIPDDIPSQKRLLRSLMNVRSPKPISEEFLLVQDEYLQAELAQKEVVSVSDLTPLAPGIYVWQGDITTLACDAIVNAANSGMTGCYYPCHGCIDNAIHSYAGVQLRLECDAIIKAQGHEEPTGTAKITEAYNLPCRFIGSVAICILETHLMNSRFLYFKLTGMHCTAAPQHSVTALHCFRPYPSRSCQVDSFSPLRNITPSFHLTLQKFAKKLLY